MASRRTPLAAVLRQVPAARARYEREFTAGRRAATAVYDRATGRIILELSNGCLFGFPPGSVDAIADFTPEQLALVTVMPGGSLLEWDAEDVHLSVPGLLMSSIGRAEKFSEFARLAGSTRSKAKAAAARRNGKKGGRPRKTARR
jgi:hypothetical protein